jgi:hypothetical protein
VYGTPLAVPCVRRIFTFTSVALLLSLTSEFLAQNQPAVCMFNTPLAVPCVRRIFTFTYVALLFGLMGYNVELEGLDGFNSINNMLFTTVLIMLLMPYVGISLYTADKTMYIADASARRYRTSAYYVAKVCW